MAKESPLDKCPTPGQLKSLIEWLESGDDREMEDDEFIEWLRQFLPDDVTEN
jgi:hypothetical protein